ncbi:inositol monophosphatase [Burkholderia pseudomultivorans]|uniref:inositol monophosphatase family protein n=1 Tax=Burkholderia pseudomultivorans TaxID=1207504 RepID=UPI0028752626|nr:inositol monophosphatase family protein [Burkholderia pseudomultivorans]MDS0862463.1 inositol monophosphatase [Burkholderia pseudomultivorans]
MNAAGMETIGFEAELANRYALVCKIAREAGERAYRMFMNRAALEIEHKGLQDVVSLADREVENLVRERVRAAFPDDAFLGEETAAEAGASLLSERVVWIVDPIDGTSCFLNGMHAWCISIGVLIDGEPAIGAVFDPNSGELFHAATGCGAFVNDTPIQTSTTQSVRDGVVGVGFSHRVAPSAFIPFLERLLVDGGMFVRNGSGALMIAYVAAGRLIGYYEPHINSWDCVAGIVLVREAGGVVNDFLAGTGLLTGNPIIAAAGGFYPALVALITG